MNKLVFLVSSLILFSSTVFATGSTYCKVDNEDVSIEVDLSNARAFGNPVAEGVVKAQIKKDFLLVGIPAYLFKQSKGEIPYWFNLGGELKFAAYVEPELDREGNPLDFYASLAVIVDTKYVAEADGPGYYAGTYTVEQTSNEVNIGFKRKSFEGYIRCDI